tara:strand:- start:461 stop:1492 length:1032 start_codon:yes stop_codon:yes gene_type:complete
MALVRRQMPYDEYVQELGQRPGTMGAVAATWTAAREFVPWFRFKKSLNEIAESFCKKNRGFFRKLLDTGDMRVQTWSVYAYRFGPGVLDKWCDKLVKMATEIEGIVHWVIEIEIDGQLYAIDFGRCGITIEAKECSASEMIHELACFQTTIVGGDGITRDQFAAIMIMANLTYNEDTYRVLYRNCASFVTEIHNRLLNGKTMVDFDLQRKNFLYGPVRAVKNGVQKAVTGAGNCAAFAVRHPMATVTAMALADAVVPWRQERQEIVRECRNKLLWWIWQEPVAAGATISYLGGINPLNAGSQLIANAASHGVGGGMLGAAASVATAAASIFLRRSPSQRYQPY